MDRILVSRSESSLRNRDVRTEGATLRQAFPGFGESGVDNLGKWKLKIMTRWINCSCRIVQNVSTYKSNHTVYLQTDNSWCEFDLLNRSYITKMWDVEVLTLE